MKADDLHLFDLLELDPDRGSIQFKNRRMLLWDADAFGNLRRELIDSVGIDAARPVLKRFGFANGYRDARTTGELFTWDNDAEWWLSCPALQANEGKVHPKPKHLVVDRDAGLFEMEVEWNNSYEAEQHLRVFGPATEPVCWTLTGFASGFSTALMGEEVYVVETECVAMGHKACQVKGTTRRAWRHDGDRHAADYLAKNLAEELEQRESELRRQRRVLRRRERELAKLRGTEVPTRGGIVSRSRAMDQVLDLAQAVARAETTVLIRGESGVGKELVARYIHDDSRRTDGPFIAINCGALPEALLESELFGHQKGSFTGADSDKRGLFEAAQGGTIFLDEIGETTAATQVKLLRVLQEREVRPVGATEARVIDVRVIAATNRDLEEMVREETFRKDLYYRLKVIEIDIPPLRERPDDVAPLAREFVATHNAGRSGNSLTLSPECLDALTSYHWPGNVRELQNAIERAVVLADDSGKLKASDLPRGVREGEPRERNLVVGEIVSLDELQRRYILEVLSRNDGNRTHTARALGIGANTLWRKLKTWGVPSPRDSDL